MKTASECPLAVLIAVRNEEKNIADAIKSVAFAQQVFVIDSRSDDRTCEIAERLGAQVFQFDYDGGWPKKRNWGLRHLPIECDWVLILDGDERVTPELQAAIERAIQRTDINGYYLRWKFMFLGRWMKHCWSHGWMLRLIRRGCGEYEDLGMRGQGGWDNEVHENIVVEGVCRKLNGHLLHESNEDLEFWIRKQNEFSTWNAVRRTQQLAANFPPASDLFSRDPVTQRKWLKALFLRLPFKPTLVFIWLYVVRRGFLDGRAGFYFCRLRAMHELNIQAKIFELRQASE
ncbi:MAG: glycosyltransferase family 2 protein [Planctomycetaceae bacterium]